MIAMCPGTPPQGGATGSVCFVSVDFYDPTGRLNIT